jgi:hypothetical protein
MTRTNTGDNPDNEFDDEIIREFVKISTERLKKSGAFREAPKKISGQIHHVGNRLARSRKLVGYIVLMLMLVSALFCYFPNKWSFMVGALSIASGFTIPILLLGEFLSGAGSYIQSEFKDGDNFYRELEFRPSVTRFTSLVGFLASAAIAIVIGFATVYAWFDRFGVTPFSASCSKFSSIYFSIVTFATVGFGDIYPISIFTRGVVVAEIAISVALLSITFSALVSWLIFNVQREHDRVVAAENRKMQNLEELMKRAGVGVYGNAKEQMEEARRRVNARKAAKGTSNSEE